MRNYFIGITFSALSIILLVVVSSLSVGAQDSPTSKSALSVSPAIIETVLDPGEPVPFTLRVSNITNFPLPIKATVHDFTVQSNELEKTERERLNASQWFTINEPDFILQPNQTRTVEGTIIPPAGAEPGGHYATIFFQPLIPREALSSSTAYMNSRVGVLAFLVVKGDIVQRAQYAKPLSAPWLVQSGPVDFTFSIRNTGNVHLMPIGKLKIYGGHGEFTGEIKLPPGIILPNATKKYTLTWQGALQPGQYQAELEVMYGNDTTTLQKATVSLWIMPWLSIAIGLISVLGVTLFIMKTRLRWRKAWRALFAKDMHDND